MKTAKLPNGNKGERKNRTWNRGQKGRRYCKKADKDNKTIENNRENTIRKNRQSDRQTHRQNGNR